MNNKCKCGCHKFGMLLCLLSCIALIGYVWIVWFGSLAFLGRTADELFQHIVILSLIGLVMKGRCKCCCGDSHCETCKISEKN